jgi:cytochrome b6-f complex iron-sulfur subunit
MSEQITNPVLNQEDGDESITRRNFVKVAVGGMGLAYIAAIGYPIYRYLNSPVEKSMAMAAVHDVTLVGAHTLPVGSVLAFKFGAYPALLIHHKDNTWVAFDAVCTHLGCTVQYHPDEDKIKCACHGGVYNAHNGENISGPPPKPLTKYLVKVEKAGVTVSRI